MEDVCYIVFYKTVHRPHTSFVNNTCGTIRKGGHYLYEKKLKVIS